MDKVIGHDNVVAILNKLIEEDKVSHAYIFSGIDGIGKKMLALYFAKCIMGESGDEITNESDFKLITPEKDLIKVDVIRTVINEIYLKPVLAKRKVIIIDDAEKMNVNAQNALLKVLEEPPKYAVIILVTSNSEKIIKTIKSRANEIKFNKLTDEEVKKIIDKDVDVSFARGSVKKALQILNDNQFEVLQKIVDFIYQKDYLGLFNIFRDHKLIGVEAIKLLELLKIYYTKNLKENMTNKIFMIEEISKTITDLKKNGNVELALDAFIIRVLEGK